MKLSGIYHRSLTTDHVILNHGDTYGEFKILYPSHTLCQDCGYSYQNIHKIHSGHQFLYVFSENPEKGNSTNPEESTVFPFSERFNFTFNLHYFSETYSLQYTFIVMICMCIYIKETHITS